MSSAICMTNGIRQYGLASRSKWKHSSEAWEAHLFWEFSHAGSAEFLDDPAIGAVVPHHGVHSDVSHCQVVLGGVEAVHKGRYVHGLSAWVVWVQFSGIGSGRYCAEVAAVAFDSTGWIRQFFSTRKAWPSAASRPFMSWNRRLHSWLGMDQCCSKTANVCPSSISNNVKTDVIRRV